MKCYQPEAYFTIEIEDKNKMDFMEAITFRLTGGATFLVTTVGVNCNVLIETSDTRSCISKTL